MVIGSTTLTSGSYYSEMFLAKYDAQGNALWARQSMGTDPSGSTDVAVDNSGNAYLTGYIGAHTRLDQFTFSFGVTSAYRYLAKYDSQGTAQWVKTGLGDGTNAAYLQHRGLAVDATGQVYLVGYFGDTLVLGTTTLGQLGGGFGMYLAKFTPQGNVRWVKQLSTNGSQCCNACNGLAVDPCGDVVMDLAFEGTFAFDSHSFTSTGGTDILTIKCSPQGNFRWGTQLGGTYVNGPNVSYFTDYVSRPVLDASGNSYIAARLYGSPTLTTSTGNSTLYEHLVCFSPTGAVRWARLVVPGGYGVAVADVAVSGPGNLFVTGAIEYPTPFDATTLPVIGFLDAYLAKLDADTLPPTSITCAPTLEEDPTSAITPTTPNIITPNGDNQNENFRLPDLPAGLWQITIYNRWGTRVYQSDDYRQDWNAPGLPDGQYYYYLQAAHTPARKGWVEVKH